MQQELFAEFDLRQTLNTYVVTVLLEIIQAEGGALCGYKYLAKKCYFAAEMRGFDLFAFQRSADSVSSRLVNEGIGVLGAYGFVRVLREIEATCRDTRNYCGEMRQEHITLYDEEVVNEFIQPVEPHPDFQVWREVIAQIDAHPKGRDWHVLSVAVRLYSYLRSWYLVRREEQAGLSGQMTIPVIDQHTVIADVERRAGLAKVYLPETIFDDAFSLIDDLGL